MVRPCFLVLDPEHSGSISTRKLVIETAKFNVVTAYSGPEAIETFERYPAIDAAVLDARATDMPPTQLIQELRSRRADLPIVVLTGPTQPEAEGATYTVDPLDPRALLDILRVICPEETKVIEEHDQELEASGE